ncbi:MAG: hypothetical protein ACE5I9_03280 [Candidatus Methylomirabilales bacterium]
MRRKRIWQKVIYACVSGMFVLFTGQGVPASNEAFIEKGSDGVTIVKLTQTPCLFLESEENPQAYTSTKKQDCEEINRKTAAKRTFKTLRLKPGKYIFRVTNKNVPYKLGFWLRGQGVRQLTLPSVSGGGLTVGKAQDYEVNLVKGKYYYSCPLNPTPNYPLIVE